MEDNTMNLELTAAERVRLIHLLVNGMFSHTDFASVEHFLDRLGREDRNDEQR